MTEGRFSIAGRLVASLIVGLIAAACSHAPLPTPEDDHTARLVIVREASGPAWPHAVKVDGADVVGLGPGQYAILPVEAGRHVVSITCSVDGSPTWTEEESLEIMAAEGAATYMAAAAAPACVAVRAVSEPEGRRLVEGAGQVVPLHGRPRKH